MSLQSVLAQTITDLEIIVVDGSNNDDTRKQVNKINDSRINYLQISNISAANSRNIGIDKAKGEFIAFNDDDDVWYNNKIERQLDIFKKRSNEKIVVYSTFIRSSGKHTRKTPDETIKKTQGDIYNEILQRNFVGLPTVMLPFSCCKKVKFDEGLQCLEDWDWFIRLAKKFPFELIKETLVTVGNTPKSVNKSAYSIKSKSYRKIYEKYYKDIKPVPGINSKHLLSIGNNMCLSGNLKEGRKYLFDSFKINKKNPIIIISYLLSFMGKDFYRCNFELLERLTNMEP